ncbi:hypothetical protein GCM10022223_33780 [Kineosporia mesophila]|uniref:DUF1963 domain-containing protein n=1 Tax=Kineosporia mesophila TaxID=566012 RepID=A0ABP6ZS15_9ACTN|nr:DUF1963 domain-containing protein [Kineosporia mesophila]MCD5354751.1 DUF1963 domain-containing protein [Kineosporia mesophila]
MDDRQTFREAASRQGLPVAAVDWWVQLARPRLELIREAEGPAVGRFGGSPTLPEDIAWPSGMTHLASIDLSAIPAGSHDLNLPQDGHLIFFSQEDITPEECAVLHVPSGVLTEEREGEDVLDSFPLYSRTGWALPEERSQSALELGEPDVDLDEEAVRAAMREVPAREDVVVAIGGYGDEASSGVGSPVENPGEEVLLVQTFLPRDLVGDRFGGSDVCILSFLITPDDLAGRSFDKTWLFSDFLG